MAVRTRSKWAYESDDGTTYAVTLTDDQGAEPGFGWTAAAAEPDLPRGYAMRYAILHDPAAPGRQVRRPVATVAATAWTAPLSVSRAVDQWNDAADVAMMISSLIGERRSYGVRPVPV